MQKKQKQECTLVWFRNDLRLQDNELLEEAIKTQKYLVAFYAFDPIFFKKQHSFVRTEKFRINFLIETLRELRDALSVYNIPLFVATKPTEEMVAQLQHQFSIVNIVYQEDATFDEATIEKRVLKTLPKEVHTIKVTNQYLYTPQQIDELFTKGIPKSFSSFRKKVEKKLEVLPITTYRIPIQEKLYDSVFETPNFSEYTQPKNTAFPFKGGEREALKRVQSYFFDTTKVATYKYTRNELLGVDYSTKFSPWLANGSLSARTIYWELKKFEKQVKANVSTYWVYFELLWRDFFKHTARFQGTKIFMPSGIQEKRITTHQNNEIIECWTHGKTASDFVNANMIELRETGWMSNRGRQNVASYFVHDLQQDWRVGAAYFESLLLDYDPHSNYGNWMYIAGVGNDTRNKKFDVNWQANTYDAKSVFTNQWNKVNE
ncbi:DASH family cryptochrome [Tenacibaculum tangerinum]|uniref:Cryptochrome DASH n=1 Tax=Tenacibaculum tangerinum TaxID=3038772 RepID=A0ABY8KZ15_9FLAO|nr:DASH family cryptochrome [Tenacibaculum tangerinum]WGH74275.1 DASH family cryptochrome [Tenacibaculum tangerinum]